MDGKFAAMHRTVILVKKYGQKLPDATEVLFEAAPHRWNNLRTKVSLAKQRLGPRIQSQSDHITKVFGQYMYLGSIYCVPCKKASYMIDMFSYCLNLSFYVINHFSTTGRCSGPAHYDVSIRQAARAAFVTSSFKIFLTQTFPRCRPTCYILPSRAMTQLFNGVNFVYRSVEVYSTFCSYLRVLVRIRNFYNGGRY